MSKKLLVTAAIVMLPTFSLASSLDDRDWQVVTGSWPLGEAPFIAAMIESQHSTNIASTALGIKCDKEHFFVFWLLGAGASFDPYSNVSVATSYDSSAELLNWEPTISPDALVHPDSGDFKERAFESSKMTLRANLDNGRQVSSTFDLTGLPEVVGPIQKYCGAFK